MIKFGLNSVYGQKYFSSKIFLAIWIFQEFSILGGGGLGKPPPLAILDCFAIKDRCTVYH